MTSNKIVNPIISNLIIDTEDIYRKYNCIYILASNNLPIAEDIYKYLIDDNIYNNIIKNMILIKAPISLLKKHMMNISLLSNIFLESFNVYKYELDEKNIVLPIFNITIDNILLYISQYKKSLTLTEIVKIMEINNYFDVPHKFYDIKISNYSNFINLTTMFNSRKIVVELKSYENQSNYILNAENKNNFKINNHKIQNDNTFTKDEIYNILLGLSDKLRYYLFCYLVLSKEYCHLALNNIKVLLLMKPILSKYAQLFRYLIGYAWVRFYMEETIKKTFITKNDQFIFDLDTASELPIYSFSINCPKMNPYCPILVKDNILNSKYNIGGVSENKYNFMTFEHTRLTNFKEFKKNLNVFCTGDPTKDILKNINWEENKIAIGGSAFCACIQKFNPLMLLFNNFPLNERLKRYYNEYYANSDIDMMFLTNDTIDFMTKSKTIYNQIVKNVCEYNTDATESNFKLIPNKICYLFLSKIDIEKAITKNNKLSIANIKLRLEDEEIKKLFFDIYQELLEKYKQEFMSKLTVDEINNYSENYPDYINFDNLIFKIRFIKNDFEKTTVSKLSITFKYKITSVYLDQPFELFMVNYNDFFATVQTFHLPCVRGYYDGSNVYLTPSCVSAHMTLMNLDYRYFSGSNNPIQIINKYRMRGFGTWLNENEKIILLKYTKENEFWNNLYGINFVNEESILSNLGSLNLNHKLFRPRLYNTDYYNESTPVDIFSKGYNVINRIEPIENKIDYIENINKIYSIESIPFDINHLQTINELGFINPIEKWVIDAYWNLNNKQKKEIVESNIKYKRII